MEIEGEGNSTAAVGCMNVSCVSQLPLGPSIWLLLTFPFLLSQMLENVDEEVKSLVTAWRVFLLSFLFFLVPARNMFLFFWRPLHDSVFILLVLNL